MKLYMSRKEFGMISHFIEQRKVQTMLEWGSGGSTIKLAELVNELHSIENDKKWYEKVSRQLLKRSINNVKLYYVPNNMARSHRISKYEEFKDYVDYVDTLQLMFDAVLIDGRARPYCAEKVLPYLQDDAVVFIHDFWEREYYFPALKFYDVIASVKRGQTLAVMRKKKSF